MVLVSFNLQAFAYTDTDGHWAKDTIETLSSKGIINGYTLNTKRTY